MIDVYGGDSPNVIKVLIALEELGMGYRRLPLDIFAGEQFTPAYLAINPNGKIPGIVDHAPEQEDGLVDEPLAVFESGAILIYLAEKAGDASLLPATPRARSQVLSWVMWQMAGQGPMAGQAGHFRNYAPELLAYPIQRYSNEIARLYGVLDARLSQHEWLAGDFSIADIACFPWILFRAHHGIDLDAYPNVARWFTAIEARPSFARAMPGFEPPAPIVPDEATRKILFNIKD